MTIENKRVCSYRNCKKDISYMRRNAKYCCRLHKNLEKTYKNRKGGTKN